MSDDPNASVEATLEEHSKMIAQHGEILKEHGSQLQIYSKLADQQSRDIRDFNAKISEMHGENRARSEGLEKMVVQNDQKLAEGISEVNNKVDQLASIKSWVGWVLVIVTTSGVLQLFREYFGR